MSSVLRTLIPTLLLALTACEPSDPAPQPREVDPPVLEEDFGVIRHGLTETRDLLLLPPGEAEGWFPTGFQRSCTCAHHQFVARSTAGVERILPAAPDPDLAASADEGLLLRLTVDTRLKEAADLRPEEVPGQVTLQRLSGSPERRYVRIRMRFGIDAPITVRPFAHLDVGELPRSLRYSQTLEIDREGQSIEFGMPRVVDPGRGDGPGDIQATLEQEGDLQLLRVSLAPDRSRLNGPFRVTVEIPTNLDDGYVLPIPVSGIIVSEIQVGLPKHFAFGHVNLREPHRLGLIVTDHDHSRPADFVVVGIVDQNGADASEHFSVSIDPVGQHPRKRSVTLSYDGKSTAPWVRGTVQLAKTADQAPLLELSFSGFHRN